jgi:hypothetical protein
MARRIRHTCDTRHPDAATDELVGDLEVGPRRHRVGGVAFRGGDRCYLHPFVVTETAGPARAGLVAEPVEAVGEEPSPPLADLMLVHADLLGDAPQRDPIGAQQHDPRSPRLAYRRGVGVSSPLQLGAFLDGQLDGLDGEHGTSTSRFTTSNHTRVIYAGMH